MPANPLDRIDKECARMRVIGALRCLAEFAGDANGAICLNIEALAFMLQLIAEEAERGFAD